jgi:hypothetical protein
MSSEKQINQIKKWLKEEIKSKSKILNSLKYEEETCLNCGRKEDEDEGQIIGERICFAEELLEKIIKGDE